MKELKTSLKAKIIGLLSVLLLSACNTNEVFPVSVPEDNSAELIPISASEVLTSFGPNSRQTFQFSTTQATDNVGNMYFYSSHDITTDRSDIVNLILVFHGLSASDSEVNAEYNSLLNGLAGTTKSNSTLVLAPHFFHLGEGIELDWDNAIWRVGGKASRPEGVALSSSQILDFMLEEYFLENSNFQSLQKIFIVGHSAGGQLAQRYAAISETESSYPSYSFVYLPSNASHYLYLSDQRWNGASLFRPTGCDSYNEYPYGLDSLSKDSRYAFISGIGLETIRSNYINRKVLYVLGDQDTSGATTDCESQSQEGGTGANRFTRGQYLSQYMDALFPTNDHEQITVAGAGHSANAIYTSQAFIDLLEQELN